MLFIRVFALLALAGLCGAVQAAEHETTNPATSPGAIDPKVTQKNIKQTVCVPGYTKTVRPPVDYTNKLKRKQLKEWGYKDLDPKAYEEDHIVPLAVGGHPTDPKNLWPQPYTTPWNARVKDKLEVFAHRELCKGKMTLEEAQGLFLQDWTIGFRKLCGPSPTSQCRKKR